MRGRLIVKKLQKVQKNAPKNASDGLIPVFTVFFIVNVPKGGISGFLQLEFVVRWSTFCPLGSVFGFFFPGNPKKTPTSFTISLMRGVTMEPRVIRCNGGETTPPPVVVGFDARRWLTEANGI